MRTVWKYQMTTVEKAIVMPEGAKIVHFDIQLGCPTFWAEVETEAKPQRRHFCIFGTGEKVSFEFNTHRGTCLDREYVWHLFENTIPASS